MIKYPKALYLYKGDIIGTVEDFETKNWFGKVTLNGLEEFSEYGTLDYEATVKTPDGKTWSKK